MNILKKYWAIFILIFVFIGANALYYCHVSTGFWKFSNRAADWANFGSYAAGIFTGFSFLVIVYQLALFLKNQMKYDFERTFFHLLEHHNNKLEKLERVQEVYDKLFNGEDIERLRYQIERNASKDLYSEINSYFLHLYRLLKLIDESGFNKNLYYSSILRSFLPRKLIFILAYHLCNRDETYNEYIEYIHKFHFFEHINIDIIEYDFITRILCSGNRNEEADKIISHLVSGDVRKEKLRNELKEKLNNPNFISEYRDKKTLIRLFELKTGKTNEILVEDINGDWVLKCIFSTFNGTAFYNENSPLKFHKERFDNFKVFLDKIKLI